MSRKDQKMIQMVMKDECWTYWLYIFDIFMSGKTKANVLVSTILPKNVLQHCQKYLIPCIWNSR